MIKERFIREIIEKEFGQKCDQVFDKSMLLQYLDMKMRMSHDGDRLIKR